MVKKGAIYYTGFGVSLFIQTVCIDVLKHNFQGEITSVSLNRPIHIGRNIIIPGQKGYVSMVRQILTALEHSTDDVVFFTEHDVLYPTSHFEFTPPRSDIFYYNSNVWRWEFGSDHAVRYDRMISLSGMCCFRELALENYRMRMKKIYEAGSEAFESKEPDLARKWGYEPGTKKIKRGGLTDQDFDTWQSKEPLIDIRHKQTYSPPKLTQESFKHAPTGWEEIPIEKIPGWDLQSLFNTI